MHVCLSVHMCVKGCSGRVGKMIFSAGVKQLAIVAYVRHMYIEIHTHNVLNVYTYMYVCAKGYSGRVGKMIFSAGAKQLAIVAYVRVIYSYVYGVFHI